MESKTIIALLIAFGLVMPVGLHGDESIKLHKDKYPKIIGMNIGTKNYNDPEYQKALSKLDAVILGFYRGWGEDKRTNAQQVVESLKRRNRGILIGQYTILNECRDVSDDVAISDKIKKINNSGWWLKNSKGERVQWTPQYKAWEVNFTRWAMPDNDRKRYPQWLVERDYHAFFQAVPEYNIWYTDNVMQRPRVIADWDGDGVDDDPEGSKILSAWREGYRAWWSRIREIAPHLLIVGNADSDLSEPEFRGQLNGAFLEGLMGEAWSIERRHGWVAMMKRYHAVFNNLVEPKLVGFNVHGRIDDYRFFRYAFTSCLMNNGYFSFTDKDRGYSSVPWFDEYENELGAPIDHPQQTPWSLGVYRRTFSKGMVLVNPTANRVTITIEPGFQRIKGVQAPDINNGKPAKEITLHGKDGIILIRDMAIPE